MTLQFVCCTTSSSVGCNILSGYQSASHTTSWTVWTISCWTLDNWKSETLVKLENVIVGLERFGIHCEEGSPCLLRRVRWWRPDCSRVGTFHHCRPLLWYRTVKFSGTVTLGGAPRPTFLPSLSSLQEHLQAESKVKEVLWFANNFATYHQRSCLFQDIGVSSGTLPNMLVLYKKSRSLLPFAKSPW